MHVPPGVSPHVTVRVDLSRVRRNATDVARLAGVPVLAVVKADAYGLGAAPVARAVADLVAGFCVFDPAEAVAADLRATGKPALAIGPPALSDPADYRAHGVRPAVSTAEQARALRATRPVLCVDTGMQRFACPPEHAAAALEAGGCEEAFTHATTLAQVQRLRDAVSGRVTRLHAAGSSLLQEPAARLDAVRPGLALYLGAARVSARLVEVRDSTGPAGYSGFTSPTGRHGVILAGYRHGLRRGPCLVNGRPSRILETGMQSSYVAADPGDRPGDEVVLLGDALTAQQVAAAWGTSPHEVLVRLCAAGAREYTDP